MTHVGNQPLRDEFFIPLGNDETFSVPDSVTGEETSHLLKAPSLALKSIRVVNRAAYGLFALFMVFIVWESIQFFNFLLNSHSSLAVFFSILLLILLSVTGKAIRDCFRYQRDFRIIKRLQKFSEPLQSARSTNQGKKWITQLKALYKGKPQQAMLEQALDSLPDYADDSELITHLDQHLFQKLDQHAVTVVSRHSQQTALMVALSPVALIDMLLSAWRSLRMIDELCRIYGIQPSLPARTKLLKMVLNQMVLAGAAELISGQLADFASNKLIGTISTQAGSGLGIGLYSARVGFQVMEICRPVPFKSGQRPNIRQLAKDIYSKLKGVFKGDSN